MRSSVYSHGLAMCCLVARHHTWVLLDELWKVVASPWQGLGVLRCARFEATGRSTRNVSTFLNGTQLCQCAFAVGRRPLSEHYLGPTFLLSLAGATLFGRTKPIWHTCTLKGFQFQSCLLLSSVFAWSQSWLIATHN